MFTCNIKALIKSDVSSASQFPRSSPGCDVGCMPCLVAPQSKILNGSDAEDTQALLAVLPAPSSTQILDPDWHLSSSEEEEEEEDDASYLLSGGVSEGIMEDQVDEDIGLIPRVFTFNIQGSFFERF